MGNFIKLHNEEDNSVVIVDVDSLVCIDSVLSDSDKTCSKLYFNVDTLNSFKVNETPEKIYAIINGKS